VILTDSGCVATSAKDPRSTEVRSIQIASARAGERPNVTCLLTKILISEE
jgi:hypothetical protein